MHKTVFDVIKRTFAEFSKDDCPQMAAALAYYTVFSLPPLLVLIILIAGVALGREAVEGRIQQEIAVLIGNEAAEQIQTMISNAGARIAAGRGIMPSVLGAAALVLGATGAFAQLQTALNRAWEVRPDPNIGGIKSFLLKRFVSFGMILGTGFLLLVSLILSTAITAVGRRLSDIGGIPLDLTTAFDFVFSVAVITSLFAAIFKVLPDARIEWRDVWVGSGVTAALFVLGKVLIGIYLGRSEPGSMFGAAGSLVLVLLWIYFSSLMLLLGAEFTQVWARRYGKQIRPSKGAVRVVRDVHRVDESGAETRSAPPASASD